LAIVRSNGLDAAFPDLQRTSPIGWRIPFGHHPMFWAVPKYRNTRGMEQLVHGSSVRVFGLS
jgi:hypothetical protein